MIISFSLQNWMSFRDPVTFSMVAGRERRHGERIPRIDKYKTNVLPIAAIYGGNAAGKSAFVKALGFAKRLVIDGTKPEAPIPVDRFRLDANSQNLPVRFSFELLIDEDIHEFSFAVTSKAVVEEKLIQITNTSEKTLYHRHDGVLDLHNSLKNDQFLQFAFQGTRDNQLFLNNAVSQKVGNFRSLYDWFKNKLVLITPDVEFQDFGRLLDEEDPIHGTVGEILSRFDTGILHLGSEEIPSGNISIPDSLKARLQEDAREGETLLFASGVNDRLHITQKGGELIASKPMTYHPSADGNEIGFELHRESDGSQRLIHLLPAFTELSDAELDVVFVIDELDRSLHTLLTRQLIEGYLADCTKESRSQLLFTTHDVLLMDQQLLRRDEMWVAERDAEGVSTLTSFSEYKDVRYDKDLRKSYLQGRMGGIPKILLAGSLTATRGQTVTQGQVHGAG